MASTSIPSSASPPSPINHETKDPDPSSYRLLPMLQTDTTIVLIAAIIGQYEAYYFGHSVAFRFSVRTI